MAVLNLAGMRANVDERGSGDSETLVLLHGQGGDLHTWDQIWPELSNTRRVIRYDLRDFGTSTALSDNAFSHSEDLASLLDAMSLERCDLLGVSMGGGVALNFTLNHPERLRHLLLISPQILGWDWSASWRADWTLITNVARAGDLAAAKRLWWEHPLFTTIRRSAAADSFRAEIDRFAGRQWIEDRQAPVMPDIDRVQELSTPTLLLSGAQDVDEFLLMADILAASSDLVERHDLDGGHLLHLEHPDACAQHIAAFLSAR